MSSLQEQIKNVIDEAVSASDPKEVAAGFQKAYDMVPKPQLKQREMGYALGRAVEYYYSIGEFEYALALYKDWQTIRIDGGIYHDPEVEFVAAKIHQELGNSKLARSKVSCIYMNYGSKPFEGKPEYAERLKKLIEFDPSYAAGRVKY